MVLLFGKGGKKLKKDGFTLLEVLLTVVISSVLVFGITEYFSLERSSIYIRQEILEMEQQTKQIDLMRHVIRESHIHTNGKLVTGAKIDNKKISFITTYFSGNENELYTMYYDLLKKDIELINQEGIQTTLLSNVDMCEFIYLDALGNPTQNEKLVKYINVKLKLKNKNIQIYEKMMQET